LQGKTRRPRSSFSPKPNYKSVPFDLGPRYRYGIIAIAHYSAQYQTKNGSSGSGFDMELIEVYPRIVVVDRQQQQREQQQSEQQQRELQKCERQQREQQQREQQHRELQKREQQQREQQRKQQQREQQQCGRDGRVPLQDFMPPNPLVSVDHVVNCSREEFHSQIQPWVTERDFKQYEVVRRKGRNRVSEAQRNDCALKQKIP